MNDQVTRAETAKILELARRCLSIKGDFVELGCFRGDTTVLLGELVENFGIACGKPVEKSKKIEENPQRPVENSQSSSPKQLFAYDSFAGLPEKSPQDSSGAGANFQSGALAVSKREVIAKLKKHHLSCVSLKKAWFSELTPNDLPTAIAFAFIDGDFYQSQRDGLNLVVPKLSDGGVMICHDYNNPELPGASRAVDEFLASHPQFRLDIFQTLAILTHR